MYYFWWTNKKDQFVFVHQHGGYDVSWKPPIYKSYIHVVTIKDRKSGLQNDVRDFKIYDGEVNENVTSKYNFALLQVFRDNSISLFSSYNVGEVSLE